ncbi:unnamed protein product [Macrosiphum euphorbiae]|uniref:Uncharacterized protein n=1 Tax=Macrosiphum euphorbiae TaxID=13131 RepID=A0AAV0Y4I0_9HEMI|nr:unnamed protein product [Macrosiphum euphorbiae]
MIMKPNLMTQLYQLMRKSMTTSSNELDVNWLLSLSVESIDMSAELLCLVELAEFRNVCLSWTDLLKCTPPPTSTSSLNTATMSTSATYAATPADLVGAPSSFEEHIGASTADVDFVGFLEASASNQGIMETYCDTYTYT